MPAQGGPAINRLGQTGTVALFPDFGAVHDVLVDDNYLAGARYTVYGGAPDTTRPYPSYNVVFRDNVFSRSIWPNGGYYGPVAYFEADGPGNSWTGNVWEDTG